MSEGTKTALKWGGIIALIALVIYVIYYLFKGGSNGWKEYPGKDIIPGPNLESKPSGTVEADQNYADSIGAVAFFRLGGTTWFKGAKTPITASAQGGGSLFVKS